MKSTPILVMAIIGLLSMSALAETPEMSTFGADDARALSNPSIMSPPVRRADMLAAVFELDPSAMTVPDVLNHYAISTVDGCRNVVRMARGELAEEAVFDLASQAGVAIRNSVSVAGHITIAQSGDEFAVDAGDLSRIRLPEVDNTPCAWRRVGIIEAFHVEVPDLPTITLGAGNDAVERVLSRGGPSCAQMSGRLSAEAARHGSYTVSLDVDTVRIGGGSCEQTTYAAGGVGVSLEPHLFPYVRGPQMLTSNIDPVDVSALQDYTLSAVRQDDGSWLWGVEEMRFTSDGSPVGEFVALTR